MDLHAAGVHCAAVPALSTAQPAADLAHDYAEMAREFNVGRDIPKV